MTVPQQRILVTGSRAWTSWTPVHQLLMTFGPGVVVHGGARGLDTIAGAIAESLGWSVEVHRADWDRHGRQAGMIRNQEMVALGADVVLAFPLSKSIGTWDCVRRARTVGIPVVVYPQLEL